MPKVNKKETKIGDKRVTYEFKEGSHLRVVLKFDELGLKPDLLKGIQASGIEGPSEIQQCSIPPMINGRNVMAQAQSLTGKTTALAISILQSIDTTHRTTQAVVVSPTQESVAYFRSVIDAIGGNMGVRCYTCIDEVSLRSDFLKLMSNWSQHIVLSTPELIVDLIINQMLQTGDIRVVALDGMDELMSSGFKDQILEIHRSLPSGQYIAVSTILGNDVLDLTGILMANPVRVSITRDSLLPGGINHFLCYTPGTGKYDNYGRYQYHDNGRFGKLCSWSKKLQSKSIIIFCDSHSKAQQLELEMRRDGRTQVLNATYVHNRMLQRDREPIIQMTGGEAA